MIQLSHGIFYFAEPEWSSTDSELFFKGVGYTLPPPPFQMRSKPMLLPLNKLKLTGNKFLLVSIILVMTYKSSRSFKIYSQGYRLKRNTVESPQNLCYHKVSNSILVSSHRFDQRGFILQIIIILLAQIIPVSVQLTGQLVLCNSGLGWKKKVLSNATKYRTW